MIAKRSSTTSEAPWTTGQELPGQSMRVRRHAEVIVPLPETEIPTVTGVRSTLLSSSLQTIRERCLVETYTKALPQRYHDQVLRTLAPVWLPLDAALAHYRAMDSLGLPEDQVLSIGRSVGDRLQGTFLGTIVRGVRHAGVTPWSFAAKIDRVWSRVFEGGAVGVFKWGPKDGIVSVRGLPLLEIDYFRIALRGVFAAGIETVTQKCYVREKRSSLGSDGVDFAISWV